MLEIMIVTHGKLSEGLKDAAEVIVGTSSHIETMCLESGEDIQTFGEGQRKINYDQHSRTHASIC